MPDAHDFDIYISNTINDHIGPNRRDFPCACDQTRTTALRQIFQPITGGDQLNRDTGSGERIVLSDIGSDFGQIREGLRRKDYGHFGADCSFSVPQVNIQRRTSSYGTVCPASNDTSPSSTAKRKAASSGASCGMDSRFAMREAYHVRDAFAIPIASDRTCSIFLTPY